MKLVDVSAADLAEIVWALGYAQPSVDLGHRRPKNHADLSSDESWTDEYRRFWAITQRLGMIHGVKS